MYRFLPGKDIAFRIRYLEENAKDEIIMIHLDEVELQELAKYIAGKIQSGETIAHFGPESGMIVPFNYDDLKVRKQLNQKILEILKSNGPIV